MPLHIPLLAQERVHAVIDLVTDLSSVVQMHVVRQDENTLIVHVRDEDAASELQDELAVIAPEEWIFEQTTAGEFWHGIRILLPSPNAKELVDRLRVGVRDVHRERERAARAEASVPGDYGF